MFYTARSAKAGMNWQPPAPLDIPPNRLFFSDVMLGFSDTVLPQYAQDYYFDVPFRVSSRITALQSVGRYLYVFGERELLLLTGYDDTSWQFESLGDSVGTVAPQSVQQLRGSMFYLSDGDVLMVQGGQIQSVGGDVRDLLLGLNLSAVTATVDFEQELYYLTDGDTCLVFHAQLGGWTTRAIEGRAERLLNGAGKPWALISTDEGNRLVTFDAPELLPLKVKVGPFGGPRTRRMWRSVALLLDTDAPARVDVALTGRDMDMGGQVQDTDTDPAAVMGAAGLTPVSLTLGRDGAGVTASLCWATLTVTPDPQARRCLLRGPLDFGGGSVKEAMNQ